MRKVLSLVLVLALVLGSTAFSFGAVPSDVKGGKYEDAVNVLMELDVISGYPDGSYKPAGIVTRGEMAKIIVCALGLEGYAAGASSFKDMGGHWSDKYVAYAVGLGIINGYPDGTFKPDNTVTYDEAAKMLVAALGYTEDSLVGTWPTNWVTKAKVLGILDGIKAGTAGANRGDIALMTFQTLNKAIGKTNKDGDWVATNLGTIAVPVDDTMLGRLDAKLYNPGVARYDKSVAATAGAAFVVTGDEDSVISLKELQGALITAYANDDDEIIAVKEVKSEFITDELTAAGVLLAVGDKVGDYKIKAGAIPVAAGTKLTYGFVNGGILDLAVAPSPSIDAEVATFPVISGNEYTVAVKLSGNYITEIYSIAEWDAAAPNGAVGMIDEDDLEDIADGELFTFDFKQTNKDENDLDSFALFGIDSLDDLEEDHVVYVYDDGTYISRIDVGTEVVTGTVSKITSAGTKITVAGTVYKESVYNVGVFAGAGVKIGDAVKLSLDYYGKVFDVEITDGEAELLALMVDWEVDIPTKMSDPDPVVKLFLADGTVKTFVIEDDYYDTVAKQTTLKGKFLDAEGSGGTALAPGVNIIRKGSVVEYDLNKSGEVSAIKVVNISAVGAGGFVAAPGADISKKGIYDGKYISANATIFTTENAAFIPQTNGTERAGTNKDDFGITTYANVLGMEGVRGYYHYDATTKKIDWMVIEGGGSDEDIFAAWNDWAKVDTDAGYEAYVMVDGKAVTYEANSQAKATAPAGSNTDNTMTLYKVKFASDGTVASFDEVVTGGDYTVTEVLGGVLAANKVKNNVLTIGAVDTTLDASIIVYVWDSEWVKGGVSAFSKAADYTNIVFYDINADGAIDYAFVK